MSLPGIFVVGTDTGVGKTYVASRIARSLALRGLRVGVLKPVATGATRSESGDWVSEDAQILMDSLDNPVELGRVAPIVLEAPLAPCLAARSAGKILSHEEIKQATFEAVDWWGERADRIVVEGVGGLLCPLGEGTTVIDLAQALDYPILIVARRALGTLNHTLLTVEAARARSLRIAGIVLNRSTESSDELVETSNAEELSRRLPGVALLAELAYERERALPDSLHAVNWSERTGVPRFQRRFRLDQGKR